MRELNFWLIVFCFLKEVSIGRVRGLNDGCFFVFDDFGSVEMEMSRYGGKFFW